jgi:hypothetical protein
MRADGRTDMTKFTAIFRNSANAPSNEWPLMKAWDFPQTNCKTMIQGAPLLQREGTAVPRRTTNTYGVTRKTTIRATNQRPTGSLANNFAAFLPNEQGLLFTIFRISPSLPCIPTSRQAMATDVSGWRSNTSPPANQNTRRVALRLGLLFTTSMNISEFHAVPQPGICKCVQCTDWKSGFTH